MTQTIIKCNEIPIGKTYLVEHLRMAESIKQLCEYVDAGHPIATAKGEEGFYFRKKNDKFVYDYISSNHGEWADGYHPESVILERVKLAPLAYRNGRPLHVGNEICRQYPAGAWCDKQKFELEGLPYLDNLLARNWRFADEAEAV
jgi:hypothetical protein